MLLKIFVLSVALSQVASVKIIPPSLVDVQPFNGNRPSPCNEASKTYETNPRGCSWYWYCKNDGVLLAEPFEAKCPNNLHFDRENQSCVYYDELTPRCTFDDFNEASTITECVKFQPMRLIPHPFDCEKYFLCWEDLKVERTCNNSQHFSFFDNGCVTEFLADCHAADNYCRNTVAGRLVNKDPFSCNKYHICTECQDQYSVTELQCNEDTHKFNAELNHCDIAGNVANCEATVPDEPPVDLPGDLTFNCPEGVGFHPHPDPDFCHFYFLCVNGRSFLQQCPEGTHFDNTRRTCVVSGDPFTCADLL